MLNAAAAPGQQGMRLADGAPPPRHAHLIATYFAEEAPTLPSIFALAFVCFITNPSTVPPWAGKRACGPLRGSGAVGGLQHPRRQRTHLPPRTSLVPNSHLAC